MLEATTSLGVSCIAEYVLPTDRPGDLDRITTTGDCVVIVTHCERSLERFESLHRRDRLINRRPVLDVLGYATVDDHAIGAIGRAQVLTERMRTDFDLPTLTVSTDDGHDPPFEAVVEIVIGST